MDTKNICVLSSQSAFNQQVTAHDFMVVLFTATWCDPCQVFAPVFAKVAAQTPAILFATVDVDVAMDLAANFQVTQVPALMVVRERIVIDMLHGAMLAHELQHHLHMWQALDVAAINAHFSQKAAAST